jgi:beta-glucanase (GH16 family)
MTDLTTLNAQGANLPLTGAQTGPTVYGTADAETWAGTAGNDFRISGGGGDTMAGGLGDDAYVLQDKRDVVVERSGEGVDTVTAYFTYHLPDNVENLKISGDGIGAYGNDLANVIIAGAGAQTIDGGKGGDVLTGGAGADVFVAARGNGSDAISDFEFGVDSIRLTGSAMHSFAEVRAAMTQVGSDVVLQLGGGESLTVRNASVDRFTAADFKLPVDLSKYTQTFDDEFNALSLWNGTSGTWRPDYGSGAPGAVNVDAYTLRGNGEQELYVSPSFKGTSGSSLGLNPFSVADGVLTITASPVDPALQGAMWNYKYASGAITTRPSFAQTYGYFEMRAELPKGQGFWPAFWLVRADGSWPPELDVMEMLGNDPSTYYTTVHTNQTGAHTQTGSAIHGPDTADGFHTYGVLWTKDTLAWFMDGVEVFRTATPADMNQPMYMIANLAVGGGWPGNVDGTTSWPGEMKIDYIRAYSLEAPTPVPTPTPTPNPTPTPTGLHVTGGETADVLKGGAGADLLEGFGGNDWLSGGLGADSMVGGKGDDYYVVDDAKDVIVELAGEGGDSVQASVSYVLGANLEYLNLAGTAAINGTGNTLANVLRGNDAANVLKGLAGNDVIEARGGNDYLDGGLGADTLKGGKGDDYYVVDDARDVVVELAGEGSDSVEAWVTHTLGANLEYLNLAGTAAIDGTGNELANVLRGNGAANTLSGLAGNDTLDGKAGDDRLVGGAGDDTLTGGAGHDTFVFGPGSGRDVVTDFGAGDVIDVSALVRAGSAPTVVQSGANTVISFAGGETITLKNVLATTLIHSDDWSLFHG